MTFFSTPNADALTVTPDRVARGPRVGFLRAFETSFNTQVRGAALFGIQDAMRTREDAQRRALRDAGVENIPSLSQQADDPFRLFTDFGQDYLDVARFYETTSDGRPEAARDSSNPRMAARVREYDKRVQELSKEFPDLKLETSGMLWASVKREAQEFERRQFYERQDFGGVIGGFIGGAAGAMNPNTDPLNVATLPIGGAGKTVAVRVGGQGLAQGLIETVNQLTGVQEQRKLLGLDYGFVDASTRVLGAAAGGAVIQGVGEVIGFGVRRAFRAAAGDPAPAVQPQERPVLPSPAREGTEPATPEEAAATLIARPQAYDDFTREVSPFGGTRLGTARALDDVGYVREHLDNWEGPQPWAVPPRTETATRLDLNEFSRVPDLTGAASRASVDGLARRIDPQTMGRYDALADEKQVARLQLAAATQDRDASATSTVRLQQAEDAIARLDAKIAKASAENRKRFRYLRVEASYRGGKEREGLVAQRDAELETFATSDTPAMAVIRRRIAEIDERMRDMAELVSRAYARARGQWSSHDGEREALMDMMREGRKTVGPTPEGNAFVDSVQSIADQVPMMAERPATVKADADAADVVKAVLDKRAEVADEATETWRGEAKRIASDAEKFDEMDANAKREAAAKAKEDGSLPPNVYKVDGYDEPISLDDRISIVDDETGDVRTVSVRELLDDQVAREEDLTAVQSCSIR